jgi:hypothetical protein
VTTPDDPRDILGLLAAPAPDPALTARVVAAARPLLAANAQRSSARAWLRPLLVALLPLPLLIVVDTALVRTLHSVLAIALPDALSTYFAGQYALLLLLLATLGYASIPLLADRQSRAALEEGHV